ncbi:MAG: signal peptide peptidase SppA [Truepera sp.]|nr:signal peptide peptidase SppA [Truepera sp.]
MAKKEDLGWNYPAALAAIGNAATSLADLLRSALPGKRPERIVIELSGSYPAFMERRKFPARLLQARPAGTSFEEFERLVDALVGVPWLEAVVFRFSGLTIGFTTAVAMRRQFERLRAGGKRVEVLVNELGNATYFLASAADRIVAPESAEFHVNGLALTTTFLGDALGRAGVRFDKLAIKEYKNAGDNLARAHMSDAQREQYGAYLDSLVRTTSGAIAEARGKTPEEVRGWVEEGVTSAKQAAALGMIDEVKYEDEVLGEADKSLAAARRFIPGRRRSVEAGRVALVSLEGAIITGPSRSSPVPVPVLGGKLAGSETLVRALRLAGRDKRTKAVVFHVESGGGSALASDLIGREVELLARRMPVVAVMGGVAGSGGYYVLTHATRVLAEATTLTGSIGVVSLKPVLQELYERFGVNVESIERGRFADIMGSHKPFDDAERALMQRYIDEVYERFVARVAAGRKLSVERVNEIGRGRIWSGADALGLGLVDELGGVRLALARAKELAGLSPDAGAWKVEAPGKYVIPSADDPSTWLRMLGPSLRESAWLIHGTRLAVH